MKCNLHSHTQFCDGRSPMEEIIKAALSANFSIWGFTPHAPIILDSPCNMKSENVTDYFTEIDRLRKMYPQIHILAGMEVDYLNDENGPSSSNIKSFGLDYVIGSVHFIPNQKGEFFDIDGSPERFQRILHEHFNDDLSFVVRTFWSQTQKMINKGGIDIIGHIDKIALNASFVDPTIEQSPEYLRLSDETIEMAIKSGAKIEINTKHLGRFGRFFPHPRYWAKILSSGIEMPVNSDAHSAALIEAGMEEAYEILNSIEK